MPRKSLAGRLLTAGGRALADTAREAGNAGARKAGARLSRLRRVGRTEHTCSCGLKTRSEFRWGTHKCLEPVGRWTGKKAQQIRRQIGKANDEVRRHARRVREYKKLAATRKIEYRDKDGNVRTREASVATRKGHSRPAGTTRGHLSLRSLREMDRHDRHHDKAAKRRERAARHAARLERRNARTPIGRFVERKRHSKIGTHVRKANELEARWPVRPVKTPAPRPAPAASQNGHAPRKAPANGHAPRTAPHLTHLRRQSAPTRTPR